MRILAETIAFLFCVWLLAAIIVEVSAKENTVLACSEDYYKVPDKYKKLCYKEFKDARLRPKYY